MLLLDEAHRYTHDGVAVPGVTSVLVEAGLLDFSRANNTYLQAALERGRIVHRLTELGDHNDLDPESVEPEYAGYLDAWHKFKREAEFVTEMIERQVYHASYRYAGTLDRVGTLAGARALLDIKTGQPQRATGPQTAAYAEAIGIPKLPRIGVYLQPDGDYVMRHYKDKTDFSVFLAALTLHNFRRKA